MQILLNSLTVGICMAFAGISLEIYVGVHIVDIYLFFSCVYEKMMSRLSKNLTQRPFKLTSAPLHLDRALDKKSTIPTVPFPGFFFFVHSTQFF